MSCVSPNRDKCITVQDNVVCISKQLAHNLGGIGQVCVVNKVSQERIYLNLYTAVYIAREKKWRCRGNKRKNRVKCLKIASFGYILEKSNKHPKKGLRFTWIWLFKLIILLLSTRKMRCYMIHIGICVFSLLIFVGEREGVGDYGTMRGFMVN